MGAGFSLSCCEQADAQSDFKTADGKASERGSTQKPEVCLVKKTKAKQSYQAVYITYDDDPQGPQQA